MEGKGWCRLLGMIATCMLLWLLCFPLSGFAVQDPIAEFNKLGYGKLSGKLEWLTMRRDWDKGNADASDDAASSTFTLLLNYQTPRYLGLGAYTQFIHSWLLAEGGSVEDTEDPAWLLSNDGFTLFNFAYLDYDFSHLGASRTLLRVGRQPLNLDFAPSYPIRQKEQSYEALVLSTQEIPNLDVSLGHIERYSSWSSRDRTDLNVITSEFVDVEDLEKVSYSTPGMQFISATYTGLPHLSFTLYDFYGHDLYNTIGLATAYTIQWNEGLKTELKAAYSGQWDVGRFDSEGGGEVDSDVLDLAVSFKYHDLQVEPGYFKVFGDEPQNNYRVPFRTRFTVDPLLMWFARVFQGGSDSFYLKSTYQWQNTSFYCLYVLTKTADFIDNGALDQEVNVVVSQKLGDHWKVTGKAAYGVQDVDGGPDRSQNDLRLFVTFLF